MGCSNLELLIDGLISKIVVVIIDIVLLLIIKKKIEKKNRSSFVFLYLIKIILDLYVVYTYVSRIQMISNT